MSVLADLSSGAVGGLLGGVGKLAKDIREAWTGEIPADKKAELEQKLLELENQAMAGQMAINLEEAKNENLFVAGWRPFIGWMGGFALGYAAILEPLLTWCARLAGSTVIFPVLDTTITMQVLIGILGLGAYRSYDKHLDPSPKGKE